MKYIIEICLENNYFCKNSSNFNLQNSLLELIEINNNNIYTRLNLSKLI